MICISIIPATNEEALSLLGRALPGADLVELRVDRIEKPDLPMLLYAGRGRILVTDRRRDEGGFCERGEEMRLALLREAVGRGAGLVDIELRSGPGAVAELASAVRATGGKTKLVVSHHDRAGTPARRTLLKRLEACRALGADIVKIVTLASAMEDNLRVLGIIGRAREKGQDIAAFCMGEKGRLSRAAAPLLGSCLSYASLEEGAESAPGQMTAAQMKTLMGILRP